MPADEFHMNMFWIEHQGTEDKGIGTGAGVEVGVGVGVGVAGMLLTLIHVFCVLMFDP
jgi:hypothetical protein